MNEHSETIRKMRWNNFPDVVEFILVNTIPDHPLPRGRQVPVYHEVTAMVQEKFRAKYPEMGVVDWAQIKYVSEKYGTMPEYGNRKYRVVYPSKDSPRSELGTDNTTPKLKQLAKKGGDDTHISCPHCSGTGYLDVSKGKGQVNLGRPRVDKVESPNLAPPRVSAPVITPTPNSAPRRALGAVNQPPTRYQVPQHHRSVSQVPAKYSLPSTVAPLTGDDNIYDNVQTPLEENNFYDGVQTPLEEDNLYDGVQTPLEENNLAPQAPEVQNDDTGVLSTKQLQELWEFAPNEHQLEELLKMSPGPAPDGQDTSSPANTHVMPQQDYQQSAGDIMKGDDNDPFVQSGQQGAPYRAFQPARIQLASGHGGNMSSPTPGAMRLGRPLKRALPSDYQDLSGDKGNATPYGMSSRVNGRGLKRLRPTPQHALQPAPQSFGMAKTSRNPMLAHKPIPNPQSTYMTNNDGAHNNYSDLGLNFNMGSNWLESHSLGFGDYLGGGQNDAFKDAPEPSGNHEFDYMQSMQSMQSNDAPDVQE